jgi:hypothetical protein
VAFDAIAALRCGDVAARVQHDELLRRIRRHDGRRLHGDGARLQRKPAAADQRDERESGEPEPLPATRRSDRREAAVDPEFG